MFLKTHFALIRWFGTDLEVSVTLGDSPAAYNET